MPSISTNIAAMTAQRNLNNSSAASSASIAKLSSGSRIVKPSDDAASLAISNRLRADIVSLEQAGRNASQGASLLSVANGALDRVGDMLARMKVLATQAVNGTLSNAERTHVNSEFTNLRSQIDDIAEQTRWNGQSLLNGGAGLAVADGSIAAAATGLGTYEGLSSAGVTMTGFVDGEAKSVSVTQTGNVFSIEATIGDQTFKTDFTAASAGTLTLTSTLDPTNKIQFTLNANATAFVDGGTVKTAADVETGLKTFLGLTATSSTPAQFQSHINNASDSATFVTGTLSATSGAATGTWGLTFKEDNSGTGGTFTITNGSEVFKATVENVAVGEQTLVSFGNGLQFKIQNGTGAGTFDLGTDITAPLHITVGEADSTSVEFQVTERSSDTLAVDFKGANAAALGLNGHSLITVEDAKTASNAIDGAINAVNTAQADIGAKMSRLEFVQANLATQVENLNAARGTFKDVDLAKEMSEFTKQQTLTQASVSMLSQANQMPQQLLRLLG